VLISSVNVWLTALQNGQARATEGAVRTTANRAAAYRIQVRFI
jgi:hypothetical protein